MSGVREPFAAGQPHPSTGRAHDLDLTDLAPDGCGNSEVVEHLEAAGSDDVATRLVTGEGRLVDQCHLCPARARVVGGDRCPRGPPPTTMTSKRDATTLPLSALQGSTVRSSHPRRMRCSRTSAAIETDSRSGCSRLFPTALRPLGRGPLHGPERPMAAGHDRSDRGRIAADGARRCHPGPPASPCSWRRRTSADVVGVDLTMGMLAQGRQNIGGGGSERASPDWWRPGRSSCPFPIDTFDALTFTYLLRYVDDPKETLRELARVVKPGGTVASLEFFVPPSRLWRFSVVALHPTASPGQRV